MDNLLFELVFCILEAGLLLTHLISGLSALLFFLPAIATVHLLSRRIRKQSKNNLLSSYCNVLSSRYSSSGTLIHSVEKACKELGSTNLLEVSRRFRLGGNEPSHYPVLDGLHKNLHEIFAFGIKTGRSVRSSIEELNKRIVHETKSKNLIIAKVGGMNSITYIGLVFFLPMFGAVSSSIFSTLAYPSQASAAVAQNIAYSVLVYIAIGLYITAYAYGERKRFSEVTSSVLPLLSIAAFVLFFTCSYISALI